MKSIAQFAFALAALVSLNLLPSANAGEMNYQGRLTDANGNPLADGLYTITFRLYNDPTSSDSGALVWGPFTTDGNVGDGLTSQVQLVNGRFNVVLGPRDTAGRELSQQFLGGDRYLEIQLSSSASPISPRQKLLHAPLALHADTADHATTATAVGEPGSSNVINIQNTSVGINEETPEATLEINGDLKASGGFFTADSGGLPSSFGEGIRVFHQIGQGEIYAYDYAGEEFQNLRLGGNGTVSIGTNSTPGTFTVGGDTVLSGSDNDGSTATLKLTSSGVSMLLDGNEIDSVQDPLFLNRNSKNRVEVSGPENDGSTAALKIISGSQSMLIDGNEIETNGSLSINTNNNGNVRIGAEPTAPIFGEGVQFNVNTSGFSDSTFNMKARISDNNLFFFENYSGANLMGLRANPDDDGYILDVYGDAKKNAGGAFWGTFSDRRLKQDIADFELGLSEIRKLQTVKYRYKDNKDLGFSSKKEEVGLIAQDVQTIFPEAVSSNSNGYLQLNINPIQWASINAIQELAEKADSLEAENTALKQRLASLEQKMGKLVVSLETLLTEEKEETASTGI